MLAIANLCKKRKTRLISIVWMFPCSSLPLGLSKNFVVEFPNLFPNFRKLFPNFSPNLSPNYFAFLRTFIANSFTINA